MFCIVIVTEYVCKETRRMRQLYLFFNKKRLATLLLHSYCTVHLTRGSFFVFVLTRALTDLICSNSDITGEGEVFVDVHKA